MAYIVSLSYITFNKRPGYLMYIYTSMITCICVICPFIHPVEILPVRFLESVNGPSLRMSNREEWHMVILKSPCVWYQTPSQGWKRTVWYTTATEIQIQINTNTTQAKQQMKRKNASLFADIKILSLLSHCLQFGFLSVLTQIIYIL